MLRYSVNRGRRGAPDSAMPRFPSQQLFILGMSVLDPGIHVLAARSNCVAQPMAKCKPLTRGSNSSTVPNMRAHRFHVHLSLQLLHGCIFPSHH